MASVTSLDKDLRAMRLDKYTPQRANEVRQWIEGSLGNRLPQGDLLEALKDGTVLCKLVNLAVPNAVRFKESAMPFVQMENISHFLRACQAPPFGLPHHDVFQTVDLYESKDAAQVLQCIEAFSRRAGAIHPSRFPKSIGGRKGATITPQGTGSRAQSDSRTRGASNVSETSSVAGGRSSPLKSGTTSPSGGASSWAKKNDIGATAPAWNIAQYGWTGGASQGNQGITFGGRRQITTPAPHVPSLTEKQRRRREEEVEAERLQLQKKEVARQLKLEREAEEERAREEAARRWEEETRKRKEEERLAAEEEKRRWEEQERQWKEEEEVRAREDPVAVNHLHQSREERGVESEGRLRGQFLSQYQTERRQSSAESSRIKELERQLEEAKERERRYEQERQERLRDDAESSANRPPTTAHATSSRPQSQQRPATAEEDSWVESEREYLQQEWAKDHESPIKPARPLPLPAAPSIAEQPPPTAPQRSSVPPRPLPNPSTYKPPTSTRPEPASKRPASPVSVGSPKARSPFQRPSQVHSQAPPPVSPASSQTPSLTSRGGPSSLLEREMERERERQREWEEGQKQTQAAAARGLADPSAGSGPGKSWDVNSYGYTGGDNLNKGGGGVYAGRRQILGPRPLEKK